MEGSGREEHITQMPLKFAPPPPSHFPKFRIEQKGIRPITKTTTLVSYPLARAGFGSRFYGFHVDSLLLPAWSADSRFILSGSCLLIS